MSRALSPEPRAKSEVVCVVMAGGRGERLWPLVRRYTPKVCVSIDGRHTLLETTLKRLAPLVTQANTMVVTTAPQADAIHRVLAAACLRPQLIVEPEPKNTAACIMLAAGLVAKRSPEAVMVIAPADHWIKPDTGYRRTIQAAVEIAQHRCEIVVVGIRPQRWPSGPSEVPDAAGIRPDRVHAGLGHLCLGRSLGNTHGCQVHELVRYVEKPSPQQAKRLTGRGTTCWSAGIFVARADTVIELMQRWLPYHVRHLLPLARLSPHAFARRAREAYRRLPAISFDHGVMAHLCRGVVIEGAFAWEDLGSWDSWVKVSAQTQSALTIGGRNVRVVNSDSPACAAPPPASLRSARAGGGAAGRHLIATVGLDDVVVVRTPDVTLICRSSEAQAVKLLRNRLERDGKLAGLL